MAGEDLLGKLLSLAQAQSRALDREDLDEFDRILQARQSLVDSVAGAEWDDREEARRLAGEVLSLDAKNEETIRHRAAVTSRELAQLRQGASTLRGYRSLAMARREGSAVLDRSV